VEENPVFWALSAASKPIHAAKRDLLFQLVREFFAKIPYVVCSAAFTAAQVDPASGLYDFKLFSALFAKHAGSPGPEWSRKPKRKPGPTDNPGHGLIAF
jgi:hypothetical protein